MKRTFVTVAPGIQEVRGVAGSSYRVRLQTARGRYSKAGFVTLEQAMRFRDAALEELALGNMSGGEGITVAAYTLTVLERRKARGYRNCRTDRCRAEKHIFTARFATYPLRSVKRRHIVNWVDELAAKGLSIQTQKHCLYLLSRVFRAGIDDGLCEVNPATDVEFEEQVRTEHPWMMLRVDEQQALLAATPDPMNLLIATALGTGMRQGEMWGLECSDVHLDAVTPHIVVRYGAPGRRPTKTGKIRVVPLVGPAREALPRWMAIRDAWCTRPTMNNLVFPLQKGSPRDKKAPRHFKNWLASAGISRRFRWHDLRHTCCSSLLSGAWGRRWDLNEVRVLLGHSSVTTTQRYFHADQELVLSAGREDARLTAAEGQPSVQQQAHVPLPLENDFVQGLGA